ncbi:urea ABC transporter permease subunit UrtB [Moritella sp. F3]|uniref:urea ABC transporter permease subunit UrtB n=1 Tax=Moritella sp. F3 TaxID=2718882 RepID=UPI001A1C25C6|nr:urea ABC transporter permease subunit UrtB [Moritella sp. F3]GIC77775.1 branched-chain amino acid ABC transporter permease [Moritella sp. F1]GIC83084.1 branched-chain amino acid ABC transporter permease [Moritella sp. F3]
MNKDARVRSSTSVQSTLVPSISGRSKSSSILCFSTLLFLFTLCTVNKSWAAAVVNSFSDVEIQLSQRNFDHKIAAINWLSQKAYPNPFQAKQLFNDLLAGRIFYHKKQKTLFLIRDYATGQSAIKLARSFSGDATDTAAQTDEGNGTVLIAKKRDFKKVSLNNKLRKSIRLGIAQLDLASSDGALREQAIQALLGNVDPAVQTLLRQRLAAEDIEKNKTLLTLALAIGTVATSEDKTALLAAINLLADSIEPTAFSALDTVVNNTSDDELRQAAERGLDNYAQSQQVYSTLETLYFGLSLGSVLALAGLGLAITFGVMGVINMAHGELIMLGAYTTYVMQQLMPDNIGLSLVLSIPAAFIVSGLVGIAIERGVIRFLYGRPLETLLATFGISLILQQTVRSVFSPLNRSVVTPDWMSGMLEFNPMLALTYNRLYIIIFCLLVFCALIFVLKKTPLGLQVRAVSQNRSMARAMGVRSEWVDAMTFGLGAGVAGIAGVALSQLTNVGPNMGQSYIIDSFMVVVFGGVGNLWGTLVAGLSLGLFNKLLEPWAGAVLAKILVLVFIILFIQKRPRGLFPQRGRAAEE